MQTREPLLQCPLPLAAVENRTVRGCSPCAAVPMSSHQALQMTTLRMMQRNGAWALQTELEKELKMQEQVPKA